MTMRRTTVFSTPIITPLLRLIAILILKLTGWKAVGNTISQPKYVLIGAPHTSNWDFPLMLLVVLKLRLQLYWMGKHTLFPFPFSGFMKWLGGIPINRSKSHNVVNDIVLQFNDNEKFVVLVPPEGTRSKVTSWKTGFYHIANNANLPILLIAMDYKNKKVGIINQFIPTDDIEKDMLFIQEQFKNIEGKIPENYNPIIL